MKESDLERKVVAYCKKVFARTYKFTSPSHRGVPDRVILGSSGILFLELKAPGKKPTALQNREMNLMNSYPHVLASWADNITHAKRLIDLVNLADHFQASHSD
jgi:hypothetical protein